MKKQTSRSAMNMLNDVFYTLTQLKPLRHQPSPTRTQLILTKVITKIFKNQWKMGQPTSMDQSSQPKIAWILWPCLVSLAIPKTPCHKVGPLGMCAVFYAQNICNGTSISFKKLRESQTHIIVKRGLFYIYCEYCATVGTRAKVFFLLNFFCFFIFYNILLFFIF